MVVVPCRLVIGSEENEKHCSICTSRLPKEGSCLLPPLQDFNTHSFTTDTSLLLIILLRVSSSMIRSWYHDLTKKKKKRKDALVQFGDVEFQEITLGLQRLVDIID